MSTNSPHNEPPADDDPQRAAARSGSGRDSSAPNHASSDGPIADSGNDTTAAGLPQTTGQSPEASDRSPQSVASQALTSRLVSFVQREVAGDHWQDDSDWESSTDATENENDRDTDPIGQAGDQDTIENLSTIDEMVVYLDGQLEDEQREQLERRLLNDQEARQHLAELQKSWDALEALPRVSCGTSFTESTVKLVIQDALKTQHRTMQWHRPLRWVAASVAAIMFLAVGYIAVRQQMTQEDRALLQQMDLIENWENYEAIDANLKLLKRLRDVEIFSQEVSGAAE